VNHANDAIRQRLESATEESFHSCEICGHPWKTAERRLDYDFVRRACERTRRMELWLS
jgi:hypothetical protein